MKSTALSLLWWAGVGLLASGNPNGLFFGLVFAPLDNVFLVKVWRYAP